MTKAQATSLDKLIARLEAASEGSRELDGMIAASLTPEGFNYWRDHEIGKAGRKIGADARCEKEPDPSFTWAYFADRSVDAPAYTTSLDAAMALVPEGWAINLHYFPETGDNPPGKYWNAAANIWFVEDRNRRFRQDGHTMPLALCIAALRARVQP